MEQTIFYITATVAVAATLLAILERHPVHAILYLVTSLFSMAVIFYLLMAPLVAVFEVILYAGAIMVLFLFVIMMLDLGRPERANFPSPREWLPALMLSGISLACLVALVAGRADAPAAPHLSLPVREVARRLFQEHGLAVELISLQLLFALVGALYLAGKKSARTPAAPSAGRQTDSGEKRE